MSFQILQRAYAPYGTAAQFPASGDSRLIYRATDTGYLYTWDASESAYKLAGIDPTTAPYLGLHAQADDSAKFGGQLPAYYAKASHTHTFTSLTSKPTTLAGYGITDALSVLGTAYDSQRLAGKLASDYQEKWKQVNVSLTSPVCAIFESSNADAQFRLVNTSSGGHTFSFGSGGSAAGAGAGFYIYDESAGRLRMKIDASTGQPVFSFFSSGALASDAYGGLSSIAGFTGTKTIGGVSLTFNSGVLLP